MIIKVKDCFDVVDLELGRDGKGYVTDYAKVKRRLFVNKDGFYFKVYSNKNKYVKYFIDVADSIVEIEKHIASLLRDIQNYETYQNFKYSNMYFLNKYIDLLQYLKDGKEVLEREY